MRLNQRGFSLVEIMTSLGVMGVIVLAVMKLSEMQGQSKVGMQGANDLIKAMATIDGVVKEPFSCAKNFAGKQIDSEFTLDRLLSSKGDELFRVGDTLHSGAYRLSEIKLGYLDNLTGRVSVIFRFDLTKKAQAIENLTKTVFIYPTLDGKKIVDCKKNINDRAQGMLKQFCFTMDPTGKGECEYSKIITHTKREFCNSKSFLSFDEENGRCTHIDQDKVCEGKKFVYGYDGYGKLRCKKNEEKADDENLKDIDEITECTTEADWRPKAYDICNGEKFTQVNRCDGESSREATGTKTDGECEEKTEECEEKDWAPAKDTRCESTSFSQICAKDGSSRSVFGTKTTDECATTPDDGCKFDEWTPDTSTKCSDTTFTQSCAKTGETRSALGTKTDGECASDGDSDLEFVKDPTNEVEL